MQQRHVPLSAMTCTKTSIVISGSSVVLAGVLLLAVVPAVQLARGFGAWT